MRFDLPLEQAAAVFNELNQQLNDLSPAMQALHAQLKPKCSVNLTWHPHGRNNLPTINGVGWAVTYLACPTDSDEPETSLRDFENDKYFVLTGDHRDAFMAVAEQGYEALKLVYTQLCQTPEYRNPYSADARLYA